MTPSPQGRAITVIMPDWQPLQPAVWQPLQGMAQPLQATQLLQGMAQRRMPQPTLGRQQP